MRLRMRGGRAHSDGGVPSVLPGWAAGGCLVEGVMAPFAMGGVTETGEVHDGGERPSHSWAGQRAVLDR